LTKKKSNDVIEESCKKYLIYKFTEDEIKELGKSLAKAFSDHSEAEGHLKSASTQIKAELSALEGNMTMMSEKIRSGYEHRNIDCRKEFDYRLGTVTITRLDTGEVVEERPMDAEETQRKLDLQPKE
jgi:hypothetical protein